MSSETIIIGISGPSASGKSLLANTIVNELGTDQVAVISEDSYYKDLKHLSLEERAKVNFDHPNALDHDLLLSHLHSLREVNRRCSHYDHTHHQRKLESRKSATIELLYLKVFCCLLRQSSGRPWTSKSSWIPHWTSVF